MKSSIHPSGRSCGIASESRVAIGRAPIAATSLRLTARDLRPNSRAEVARRRKWMFSASRSAVKTSDSPLPSGKTVQSSPMPSNPLRGIAANMSRIVSISPNSVMSNGGLCGAAAFG